MQNRRVLVINLKRDDKVNGGTVISNRNLQLFRDYFGAENVLVSTDYGVNFKLRNVFFYRQIQAILDKEKVDIVFLDNSLMGRFPKSFFKKYTVICFFHNVECLYAKEDAGGLLGLMKYFVIKGYERRNLRMSHLSLAINKRDSQLLEELYGQGTDCLLLSSMQDKVEDETALSEAKEKNTLLFVGTAFFGNTQGLFWFVENCMPYINATLRVAGGGMEKYADKYPAEYKTEFLGYVDSLDAEYKKAGAVVMPITSGYGMKTKTCEALMYGKKIFGTEEAFSGYEGLDPEGCILCKDAETFIREINAFLESGEEIYHNANRDLFLQNYSYESRKKQFTQIMDDFLQKH